MTTKQKTKKQETETAEALDLAHAPNAKTNNKIIKDFKSFAETHGLTEKSKVGEIMLTVFERVGVDVHPAIIAQQIRDFIPESKTTQSCISWYKTHYVPESRCFKSSRKSNVEEKNELIEKIKTQPSLEAIFPMLPALSVRQLKSYVERLGIV